MNYKYVLNEETGKLHLLGKCPWVKFEKGLPDGYKGFKTEAEAVKYGQLYIGKCKRCFKEQ